MTDPEPTGQDPVTAYDPAPPRAWPPRARATVPGQAAPDVVSEQGAALTGKVVIDAVNRMGAPEAESRALIADAAPPARDRVTACPATGGPNLGKPISMGARLTPARAAWPKMFPPARGWASWTRAAATSQAGV